MNPSEIPSICGMDRQNPKFAPDAITIRLLGPGVIEETKAKPVRPMRISVFIHATLARMSRI